MKPRREGLLPVIGIGPMLTQVVLIQQFVLHRRELRRKLAREQAHIGALFQHHGIVNRIGRVFTPGERVENHCKELGLTVTGKDALPMEGEFSQNLIAEKLGIEVPAHKELGEALPGRPPVMCAGCPHRGVFYVLHKLKLQVSGDIGCYTLGAVAPLNSMDTTICMGASVGVAMGMAKARGNDFAKKTVSVIGDSTFIHSGITGLIDVVYNKGINTIIILDNSITGMTGHQDNPTTGYTIRKEVTKQVNLVTLCKSVGVERIAIVDPFDVKQMEAVVKQEIAAEEPSVIIAQRPILFISERLPKEASNYKAVS